MMLRVSIGLMVCFLLGSASVNAESLKTKLVLFEVSPAPSDLLVKVREYSRKENLSYRFPFSYKNSIFLTDHPKGVSKAELCFIEGRMSNTALLEVRLYNEKYVFDTPVDHFAASEYVSRFLNGIFPTTAFKVSEYSGERDSTCVEMSMIQWPKNIF